MSIKKTATQFITKSNIIHNNNFDYSLVDYKDNQTLIKIICPLHGIFEQRPAVHLRGFGCKKCPKPVKLVNTSKKENFMYKANLIHGKKYDYSLVEYNGSQAKINILCRTHGLFKEQTPNSHLKGRGCPQCGKEKRIIKKTFTTEIFINKANKKHNCKYNYDNVIYDKKDGKVKIICPIHGEFEQIAHDHLRGSGCKKCSFSEHNGGWTTTNWATNAKESKYFNSFKLYVIECFNEEERFIKIGRTFTTVEKRFRGKYKLPYQFNILKIIEHTDYKFIYELENKLKRRYKNYKYQPKKGFGGQYECYIYPPNLLINFTS